MSCSASTLRLAAYARAERDLLRIRCNSSVR